ncbi:T9SS type A sorting domain-containing protein [Flammeovirga pacifica]|uniref:Secretion system C-terminal sorting domain-containing protein n=1 Tax=Flammeovirga pacifica TaxID=915059 RepID=A0A1S1YYS7_FLAPC|nr:T9SS type A sorting domain-containing protein [Flammeovirga pacifica]OHX66166.1 hypothetical protein NH26_07280 [Flammeovirga pacifica]
MSRLLYSILTYCLLFFTIGWVNKISAQTRSQFGPDELLKSSQAEKRDGVYEFDGHLIFNQGSPYDQKRLTIRSNQIVTICGDLIINTDIQLMNEGTLIISGSLKIDNVKTTHVDPRKFINSGFLIIGGDLLGRDEITALSSSNPIQGNSHTLHSGYMLVNGEIKDHDPLTSSGIIWTTKVNSPHYGTYAGVKYILGEGDIQSNILKILQMKHLVHHFERLKDKDCINDQSLAEMDVKLNKLDVEASYRSTSNQNLIKKYHFYNYSDINLKTTIRWNPNYNFNATIKNYTIQVSKDTSTFTTISEVIPSRDKSKFIVTDENVGGDRLLQKYYKLVVVKQDDTVEEIYLKGSSTRLHYFKGKLGPDVIELTDFVVAPNGQPYSVFIAKPANGVVKMQTGGNSIVNFDVYPNEMVIICGDLVVDNDGVNLNIYEGGILGVTKDFMFTQKPSFYTNGAYAFSNKGVIMVGNNYMDLSNPTQDLMGKLQKQIGLMVVGNDFTTAKGKFDDGVWVNSYYKSHGGIKQGVFQQSSFIEKEFAIPRNATKKNRELLTMALFTYESKIKSNEKCQGSDFHLISDKIKAGEQTRGTFVEHIYPIDLVTRAGNLGVHENKNFELLGSQNLSSTNLHQKFLHVGQDTTLTICGDLILDGNFYLSNYGNLIITGDLIIDNLNPYSQTKFKVLNLGSIIVGGDYKGVEVMTESYPGFVNNDSGRSFILGKVYKHSKTNNQWLEEVGDDSNIFQINALGDIANFNKENELEQAIQAYEKMATQCSGVSNTRIQTIDNILINTIGVHNTKPKALYDDHQKQVKVDFTMSNSHKMKYFYILRRTTDDTTKYVIKSILSRKKTNTATEIYNFADTPPSPKPDSVQYVVIGTRHLPNVGQSSNHRSTQVSSTSSSDVVTILAQNNRRMFVSENSNWECITCVSLPITLSNFSVTVNNNEVDLVWVDQQEINASHFIIERSTDGKKYEAISDKIEAAGNSNTELSYSFTDENPPKMATLYYRLVEVDFDGKSQQWVRTVHLSEVDERNIRIYPVPADTELHIEFTHQDAEEITLVLINAETGQKSVLHGSANYDKMSYNVSAVAAGIYVAEIYHEGQLVHNQKIVIK